MKKLLSSLLIIAALGFVACDSDKKTDKTEADRTEKIETPASPASPTAVMGAAVAHVCNADCKDGIHMYAHGDVGHTCTEACGTAHICTDKCTGGANHVYAHGDAGHTCTEACMKM
ncbi:MAG: hypothetical protein ABIP79_02750 [Chitinophagaceae bacterium]